MEDEIRSLTRVQVLRGIDRLNAAGDDSWLNDGKNTWVVEHEGRCYAPKHIVAYAIGVENQRSGFHTQEAVRRLRRLGFTLRRNPD